MIQIERMAASIRPTAKFLAWLNSRLTEDEKPLSLEDIQSDATMLLIPVIEDELELHDYFEFIYKRVFEYELDSWYGDQKLWPGDLSFQLFQEWFDIEVHSLVYDAMGEAEEFELVTIQ